MPTSWSTNPHAAPETEGERLSRVEGFLRGTLPKTHWTHAAHLTVGSHFVYTLPFEDALVAMRGGVRAYNESVGTPNTDTSGYHETLTRMWLMVLASLNEAERSASALLFAQIAVRRYGHRRDLHTRLYSFDVVRHTGARRHWMAPDMLPAGGILHC